MPTFNATDVDVSAAMQEAWVRFAATGDPNGGTLPRWPRYEELADPHLEFGDVIRPGAGLRARKLDFVEAFLATQGAAR